MVRFRGNQCGTAIATQRSPPTMSAQQFSNACLCVSMISASNNHEISRVRIAVADDELELRDYWQEILPRLGYELVGIVSSGEELVALCQQAKPDVIITDVCFDGLSGIEAIAVIRPTLMV